ncbi:hypothetical protein [Marmoricola sp. URHA0025 HA25]
MKLLERAAGTAVHAVRHPISSAAYAAGLARGLAGAALHGTMVKGHDPEAGAPPVTPRQRSASRTETSAPSGPREPQRVPKPVPAPEDLPEPIVIEAVDEEPGESFATEPKAVSRESAHGGGRPVNDAEIDAWIDEAMAGLDETPGVDVETPVGTTGAAAGHNPDTAEADLQQRETLSLLDPGELKSVRSESETLRKGADPEKG